MRLPNFDDDSEMNALRAAMNATFRNYVSAPSVETLTIEDLERLAGDGIEVSVDEVKILNDGTHYYKGRRVIVYIRDVAEYGARTASMPKYHLSMCDTLTKMIEQGRYKKRYVVATRDDGKFSIQRIKGSLIVKSDEQLDVCQNCLQELNYRSFSLLHEQQQRREMVSKFSLVDFFGEYGKSCVWAMPRYDDIYAPTNVYTPQFYKISKLLKERRGYRCESPRCGIDLSSAENQRFLHAHHIDSDKSDNHPSNIKLLCIRCHADEFQHSHLRENPDYTRFSLKFPTNKRSVQISTSSP